MRVLFVNQYYPPDVSATAYLLGELAEDLARHHDVWVVAGRPSYNPEVGTYEPSGVRLKRMWSTSLPRRTIAGRATNYGTFLASSLTGVLRVPRPDVVVAMTDPPVIGLVGLLGARFHRCPFVYICEDVFPDVALRLGRMREGATANAWRRVNRLLRRNAARVVAIGRDMVEKLQREGVPSERITLIPNWAETTPIGPGESGAIRAEMGWADRFVVMHAGNVGLAQDLAVLVDAAELLRDQEDVLVVIVGDGAARPSLERRVEQRRLENVVFMTYRPKQDVHALVAAADLHTVTLAPGLWGSVVPTKVYGIMAAGKPFVAAVDETSEPHRIVDEVGCGIRVPPGDSESLAMAILELRGRRTELAELGMRGRKAFEGSYERTIATSRYRDLLESVADR